MDLVLWTDCCYDPAKLDRLLYHSIYTTGAQYQRPKSAHNKYGQVRFKIGVGSAMSLFLSMNLASIEYSVY